jgi:hypothetical protein
MAWPELGPDSKLAMERHAGRIGILPSSILAGIHRCRTWNITFAASEAAESTLHNVNQDLYSWRMHTYSCSAADGLLASVGISCATVQVLQTLWFVAVEQRRRRRRRHPSIDRGFPRRIASLPLIYNVVYLTRWRIPEVFHMQALVLSVGDAILQISFGAVVGNVPTLGWGTFWSHEPLAGFQARGSFLDIRAPWNAVVTLRDGAILDGD